MASAKSIFLVVRLLLEEDIITKFYDQFHRLAEKKRRALEIWEKHYPELHRMEYPPLYLHEHFKTIGNLAS